MEVTLLVHQIRLAERVPLSELTHNVKSAEKACQGIAFKQVCQSVTMQASNKVAGAEGIASQDAVLQSVLYQGLTEMLREVAESRAKVAAGVATDNQGYLLQEWRPFNSRQWLGEYLLAQSGTQIAELRDSGSTPE